MINFNCGFFTAVLKERILSSFLYFHPLHPYHIFSGRYNPQDKMIQELKIRVGKVGRKLSPPNQDIDPSKASSLKRGADGRIMFNFNDKPGLNYFF